jgi:hypothetical protein
MLSLLSNPIGTLWAILSRQEAYRRAHRRALCARLPNPTDFAIVAGACDHYGWYDPLTGWLQSLRNRIAHPANETNKDGHQEAPPEELPAIAETDLLDALELDEQYYFARAGHEIVSHSADTKLGSLFAILGLLAALIGAYTRYWANRERAWLSTTVANVTLTFHFIALVQISGSIGAFTSSLGPLHALQELQQSLRARNERLKRDEPHRLSLHLNLDEVEIWKNAHSCLAKDSEQYLLTPTKSSPIFLSMSWRERGRYLGMNTTWRPQKRLAPSNKNGAGDRGRLQLLFYAVIFVTLSYATALYLSWAAVGRAGFGCRCLIWTLIYLTWLASVLLDSILNIKSISSKQLWRRTTLKDIVISFLVVGAIFVEHIGLINTCFCVTGSIFGDGTVNFWPPNNQEWRQSWIQWPAGSVVGFLLVSIMLLVVQLGGKNGSLLCPSKKQRDKFALRIQDELPRKNLGEGGIPVPEKGSHLQTPKQ